MSRILVLSVVLFMSIGCAESGTESVAVTKAAFNAAGAPTVEFSVPDMMCEDSCAKAVHEILASQPGAKEVQVDFPNRLATVAVDEATFDSQAAIAALVDMQFTNSKLVEAPDNAPEGNNEAPEQPTAEETAPSDS